MVTVVVEGPDRFVKHEEYIPHSELCCFVLPLLVRIAHTVWYKQNQFNFLFFSSLRRILCGRDCSGDNG